MSKKVSVGGHVIHSDSDIGHGVIKEVQKVGAYQFIQVEFSGQDDVPFTKLFQVPNCFDEGFLTIVNQSQLKDYLLEREAAASDNHNDNEASNDDDSEPDSAIKAFFEDAINRLRGISSQLEDASSDAESVRDDESDAMENVPESLQDTDRYYAMEEATDALESAVDALYDATSTLDEVLEIEFEED